MRHIKINQPYTVYIAPSGRIKSERTEDKEVSVKITKDSVIVGWKRGDDMGVAEYRFDRAMVNLLKIKKEKPRQQRGR